ncbi:peptidoglycan-binding protein [Streptomyces sp. NRRL WC-3618]|uniref:LysM peptidoglycan-binding domain-containing protein n=1 Tax=Streptomyces sp. NRRL WC-3618 TaxID=1519490 RepID=UPI0006AECF9F|nr:peptidoglycan-binding protein [Streptomyces sp. NRRL WC-3618]
MTTFHVAVDHPDPGTHDITTTYLGTVDQAHIDRVRAIAALPGTERHVKEHPRHEGAFMVLRDDGDLDVYEPTSPAEHLAPEPLPETPDETGDRHAGFLSSDIRALGDAPHSASGPAYIDGVTRLGDQRIGGAMDTPLEPPRAVWHTTESPAGGDYFTSVAAFLIRAGVEPQVIYCPVTDRLGQFGPLNLSSRALKNDGTKRTNRTGKVCIQIEVLGRASAPWTKGFDPKAKPNFQRLLTAIRAHDIPDVWPVGALPATAAAATERPRTTWENKGGHYGHSQIPGQDHWDPGALDTEIVPGRPSSDGRGTTPDAGSGTYTVKAGDTLTSIATAHRTTVAALLSLNGIKDADEISVGQRLRLPTAGPAKPPAPRYEPFPGTAFFHAGRRSPLVTALGRRLVALGFGKHYTSGPGPEWSEADRLNVADFQRSRPELAGDADGIPGTRTWAALKIPKL